LKTVFVSIDDASLLLLDLLKYQKLSESLVIANMILCFNFDK